MDAGGGGSDLAEAVGSLFALGEEERDFGEDGVPETADAQVAGKGAVGDAGVGDGDGDVSAVALGEEAGPELGLHEDEEVGPEEVQVAADGGGEVEGEIEDVGGGKAPAGEVLAGGGGGRDEDEVIREGGLEVLDEALGSEGFSDGDGVEPDGSAGLCAGFENSCFEGGGDQAETLG